MGGGGAAPPPSLRRLQAAAPDREWRGKMKIRVSGCTVQVFILQGGVSGLF
jgi:hypothetical protein